MATIDMTQRKLNFPPRFLPYLEKHRIFELFHECVEMLVQVKPRDHIRFLKNVLPCAAMKKDKQRIVFISPTSFDRETFSELLADCLGIQAISLSYLEILTKERMMASKVETEIISESQEEESCICPGEGKFGPLYYPQVEEEPFLFGSTESEPSEPKIVEQTKESCICVCPCVKNKEEEEKEGGEERKEEEGGGKEEGKEKDRDMEKDGDKGQEMYDKGEGWEEESYGNKYDIKTETPHSENSEATEINFGILAECEISALGWILQDFPMTGAEAERLAALGIIPTHALRIITDEEEEAKNVEYKMAVKNWMKAYKSVPVTTIRIMNREIHELAKDLCSLLSIMPHRHPPMLPRIVLIGSRGSGVKTQGQKLARKYGLVHVEFEIVIAQALQQDDEICKLYKTQLATRPDPELEAYILEKALLTSSCRNRGWVLTGYPRNIDQMRMLDIIATPPNRVIFIEVPARECFVRLYYRKVDGCLGDEYKLPSIVPTGQDSYETPDIDSEVAARLLSHPKNNKKQIIHDIEQYFLEKKEIMVYCGKTASYVDGNQEVDRVFELIEQILIDPAPPQPPRESLSINHGIEESYERLKKYRLSSGLFFNNLLLNPPERIVKP